MSFTFRGEPQPMDPKARAGYVGLWKVVIYKQYFDGRKEVFLNGEINLEKETAFKLSSALERELNSELEKS